MIFKRLDETNIEKYIAYFEHALAEEPEMMHVETADREGLRRRVKDPFYQNTTSILAMENDQVLGRIELKFGAISTASTLLSSTLRHTSR